MTPEQLSDSLVSTDASAKVPCCRGMAIFKWTTALLVVLGVAVGGYALATQNQDRDESDSRAEKSAPEKAAPDEAKDEKSSKQSKTGGPQNPFEGGPVVPPDMFDGGTAWLNSSGPISIRDLRGKIVLIDFWTYCCINCMHVLPDLEYLEEKYPNEIVVIGVHSAKFDNEKETENIRHAVQRYGIKHPVVNDSEMKIWRSFGIQAWPSLAMIDPEGRYGGKISGEGHRDGLERVIQALIKYHKAKGTLDETPVSFRLESAKLDPTPLRFPSKILADEKGKRLFIADTTHNRIVIVGLDGELLAVVGSGPRGADDGPYEKARFYHPNGMELVGDTLYVADTENHNIRTVDLKKKTVSTLAGVGEQDRTRTGGGSLTTTALNSPWDLCHVDGTLYICMAGSHQMWKHDLGGNTIEAYAGSGREDLIDGALEDAAMAQPSAVVTDGKYLYVVDSEASAIRRIPTDPDQKMTTIIGPVDEPFGRLFEFGDVDAVGTKARLQHPIGLAYADGKLYVADTYNDKIKSVTPVDDEQKKWRTDSKFGTGKRGDALDPVQFAEPEGLTVANGKLYVADTNNHRVVVVVDLNSGKAEELVIAALKPPEKPKNDEPTVKPEDDDVVKAKLQKIATGDALNIRVNVVLPDGYKLNKLYPAKYKIQAAGDQPLIPADHLKGRHKAALDGESIKFAVPMHKKAGKAKLNVSLTYGYCRAGTGGLCKVRTVRWNLPLETSTDAKQNVVELETPEENNDAPENALELPAK